MTHKVSATDVRLSSPPTLRGGLHLSSVSQIGTLDRLTHARRALQQKLVRSEGSGRDVTEQKLLDLLCEVAIDSHSKLSAICKKYDNMNEAIKAQQSAFSGHRQVVEEEASEQATTITELVQKSRLLEGITLGHRSAPSAFIVRRATDVVRYHVARGFMIVLPDFFEPRDILIRFDETATSVNWNKFLRVLNDNYLFHFRVEKTGSEGYRIRPHYSVFYRFAGTEGKRLDGIETEVYPNVKLVEEFMGDNFAYDDCYENGRFVRESQVDFLRRILEFFIPALIWEFNVAKKLLISADASLRDAQAQYDFHCKLVEAVRSGHSYDDIAPSQVSVDRHAASRFDIGTAFEVRKQEPWSKFILSKRLSSGSMPKGPGRQWNGREKRKADADGASLEDVPRTRLRTSPVSSTRTLSNTSYSSSRRYEHGIDALYRTAESYGSSDPRSFLPSSSRDKGAELTESTPLSPQNGASAAVEPAVKLSQLAMLLLESLEERAEALKRNLEYAKKRCQIYSIKFNALRMSLHAILDARLMRVAVLGDSFVRRVVNQLAHKKHEYTDTVREALASSAMLIKESGLSGDEDEQDINYDEALKEIEEQLYSSNDYFETGKTTTEKKIDSFVEDMATPVAGKVNSDYHILLQWLDSLKPIPAEST
ncbi:uncharacterized protein FOMMEDRAFT_24419 [Fomitiporia mediterranea MF3/22]|uniref:Uncharacterized protein n=1 Tax=Fomitiporia mediterranea (strain MF3/22) TaxID=694068 RepID=R7SFI1_FOMME|nr:uncharacterized protein FOMMEDRAFT_24419 [Fomitiporia mediterranea MF3/22]EJC97463.1 hypothetical protein FOMMEDRAFT_24419 [Fomitiporia mediterranea MF3/22]